MSCPIGLNIGIGYITTDNVLFIFWRHYLLLTLNFASNRYTKIQMVIYIFAYLCKVSSFHLTSYICGGEGVAEDAEAQILSPIVRSRSNSCSVLVLMLPVIT